MQRAIIPLIVFLSILVPPLVVMGQPPANGQQPSVSGKVLTGNWQGSLKLAPGIELRVIFEIASTPSGDLQGSMVSVDQGNTRTAISAIVVKADEVHLEFKQNGGAFDGKLNADGAQLIGQWKQSVLTLPLTLIRVAKPTALNRPQEPKKPYPYIEEEVTVPNATAGIKLAGTLTLPRGRGPHPAVVLITGSGPQDRDEAVMGHRPFLVLADYLTRQGLAVLRCDDRGAGRSTGDFAKAVEVDFVEDALSAVTYLRTRTEIDPQHIGLIGHSEGAIVASQAAVRSSQIAFIVMLAGPGVPMQQLLARQGHDIAASKGWGEDLLSAYDRVTQQTFRLVKEEEDPVIFASKLRELYQREIAKLTDEQRRASGWNDGVMDLQIRFWQSPWIRQLVKYDPRPTLVTVRCPVLAVNGENDIQVAAQENLDAIRTALTSGGNTSVTTLQLPGLNHLFQKCEKRSVEYGQIENTFDSSALKVISEWTDAHGFGRRAVNLP
jgi:pimeloyl-ACP methyl ester carboxylesterase